MFRLCRLDGVFAWAYRLDGRPAHSSNATACAIAYVATVATLSDMLIIGPCGGHWGSGQGQVAGTCECGNEPSGSIQCGEFLD